MSPASLVPPLGHYKTIHINNLDWFILGDRSIFSSSIACEDTEGANRTHIITCVHRRMQ